jgi:DNA-directed RNA polymerase specialized sigma24 family protein
MRTVLGASAAGAALAIGGAFTAPAALHRLTRRQREVLVLRYWSNLTEAQIADTLGTSCGTVKSTASRALDALGRHLEVPR